MRTEQQLLYKVLRNFEGMNKLDVFDLLHKMEVLLFYTKSPLKKEHIKNIILSNMDTENDIDPFQFTILPNGNFCEFEGSNDWIHIYKEIRRGFGRINPFTKYHFKTKYAPLELILLSNKNLLENVKDTDHENQVIKFLNNYKLTKREKLSRKLKLLEI